ncbi:MAG: CBS domain-containing protein [Myxococcales bacterium]|nr:CBS domain-containing protein [Myxococcales bacterium]
MTRRIVVIGPDTSLATAWDLMVTLRIRHLPVVRDGLLLGIVSDRDVLLHAKVEGDEIVPPTVQVAELMSPFPFVCDPSTHVADIVRTMTEQKIDAMPVLDTEDKLVGLVTSTDLLLLLIQYDEARPLPFEWEIEHKGGGSATR